MSGDESIICAIEIDGTDSEEEGLSRYWRVSGVG
jgi:hypothetical protein